MGLCHWRLGVASRVPASPQLTAAWEQKPSRRRDPSPSLFVARFRLDPGVMCGLACNICSKNELTSPNPRDLHVGDPNVSHHYAVKWSLSHVIGFGLRKLASHRMISSSTCLDTTLFERSALDYPTRLLMDTTYSSSFLFLLLPPTTTAHIYYIYMTISMIS